MDIKYDPSHNIAYIRFREKTGKVSTIKVTDELNIDLSPDGKIYGIELLNANKQLKSRGGSLTMINRNKSRKYKIPSPV